MMKLSKYEKETIINWNEQKIPPAFTPSMPI